MAENAKYGVSYDGKEKFILDHDLVVMVTTVFSTTKPGVWHYFYDCESEHYINRSEAKPEFNTKALIWKFRRRILIT